MIITNEDIFHVIQQKIFILYLCYENKLFYQYFFLHYICSQLLQPEAIKRRTKTENIQSNTEYEIG